MGAKGSKVQKITTDCNVQIKFPDKAVENCREVPVVTNGDRSALEITSQDTKSLNVFRSSNPNIIRITGKKENCKGASNVLLELVHQGDIGWINLKEKKFVRKNLLIGNIV